MAHSQLVRSGAVALALGVLAVPGPADAQDVTPTTATSVPLTTVPTTSVPTTSVPPSTGSAETSISVGDEVAYRAALAALSADASGPHTIDLTADITVDDGTDPTYTGTEDLTLDGNGFTLDAGGTSRLLVVDSGTDAELRLVDVTLRGGEATGDGGAVHVVNDSPVSVVDSRFEANRASGSGGALAVPSTADVVRSDFVGNEATTGDGGALDAATVDGRFDISESNFDGNRAPAGAGGAVSSVGFDVISTGSGIERSTFTGNTAAEGGALVLGTGVGVANSTFVGNTATVTGGALLAEGRSLSAGIYLTVTGNAAPEGANLTVRGRDLRIIFTVLAEPAGGGANCALVGGSFQFEESRVDDQSCPGARQVGDVGLGDLADHGGRTLTRVPQPGSPLIDAIEANYGYPSIPGGCAEFQQLEPVDQRGVVRPQDGDGETRPDFAQGEPIEVAADCDVGAVEAEAFVPPPSGPVAGSPGFTG